MELNNKYNNINFYYINNKLLFFDIFAKNNKVIIIMPVYLDYKINYDDIEIYYNNQKLNNIQISVCNFPL
jgi:hypothetical protein